MATHPANEVGDMELSVSKGKKKRLKKQAKQASKEAAKAQAGSMGKPTRADSDVDAYDHKQ
eukprot:2193910-Prorocentrum_lima.AAC.1